jgi:hypothetical protein
VQCSLDIMAVCQVTIDVEQTEQNEDSVCINWQVSYLTLRFTKLLLEIHEMLQSLDIVGRS